MTLGDLIIAFVAFLVFNGVVIGLFLAFLRWIHGKPLEFGYDEEDGEE